MPVAARLVPVPDWARSNTATDRPRRASRHAIDKPMTPAPITATSTRGGSVDCRAASSEDERGAAFSRSPTATVLSEQKTIGVSALSGEELGFDVRRALEIQSLRRYEPDQVRRISALTGNAPAQRFLSPLSGISLEVAGFCSSPAPASTRGQRAEVTSTRAQCEAPSCVISSASVARRRASCPRRRGTAGRPSN